jgi:hypothetical protein
MIWTPILLAALTSLAGNEPHRHLVSIPPTGVLMIDVDR